MRNVCTLTCEATEYLLAYYQILDDMIRGMTEAQLKGSVSQNFIAQMIPHHMAAVEMSRNVLRFTKFPAVRHIASSIMQTQTVGIEKLRAMEACCETYCSPEGDRYLYQRRNSQILDQMFCDMSTARHSSQTGLDFMRQMIPHHRGAVEMAENALQYELCPQLIPVLKNIIEEQLRGIRQMQQLLSCVRTCQGRR